MEEKMMKQEDLLKVLLNAYQKGETSKNVTTEELLKLIELEIKNVFAS